MKFGVRLPNSGPLATRQNLVKVAEEAERLGFHSVWVHDHILWGSEQHRTHLSAGSAEALSEAQRPNFYESITTLAYLAGRTSKVVLGVAVIVLPLRNPVVLAKQLANLDVLSEGRLLVGVAPGAPIITKPEFEAVGSSYEERGRITDEFIAAMKKIWADPVASYSGKYVHFEGAQVFPKPVQRNLRVLIGGGERGISDRALRRVIQLGDGWIPAYLTVEEVSEGIRKIRSEAERAGRSVFYVSHEMFAAINSNAEEARKLAAKSLSTNFISPEEGEKRSLIGNPEQLAEKIRKYEIAGVDLTELKFIYSDIPSLIGMMELFSEKVLPQFS